MDCLILPILSIITNIICPLYVPQHYPRKPPKSRKLMQFHVSYHDFTLCGLPNMNVLNEIHANQRLSSQPPVHSNLSYCGCLCSVQRNTLRLPFTQNLEKSLHEASTWHFGYRVVPGRRQAIQWSIFFLEMRSCQGQRVAPSFLCLLHAASSQQGIPQPARQPPARQGSLQPDR